MNLTLEIADNVYASMAKNRWRWEIIVIVILEIIIHIAFKTFDVRYQERLKSSPSSHGNMNPSSRNGDGDGQNHNQNINENKGAATQINNK